MALYSRGMDDQMINNWEFWRFQNNITMLQEQAEKAKEDANRND